MNTENVTIKKLKARTSHQGYILIATLFILLVASLLVVSMQYQQFLALSRAETAMNRTQAYYYALGAETYAKQILHRDFINDAVANEFVDDLTEDWTKVNKDFEIENGSIEMQIEDLQAKLNLNSCVMSEWKKICTRLFSELNLPQETLSAIIDWIDDNPNPLWGGAEDNEYLLKKPPYRAANQAMGHLSELRLIANMNEQIYNTLKPYISVVPIATTLNVNTASSRTLQSLSPEFSSSLADAVIQARQFTPFKNLQDFNKLGIPKDVNNGLLSVMSYYFVVKIKVKYSDYSIDLVSILYRDAMGRILVLSRDFGQDIKLFTDENKG